MKRLTAVLIAIVLVSSITLATLAASNSLGTDTGNTTDSEVPIVTPAPILQDLPKSVDYNDNDAPNDTVTPTEQPTPTVSPSPTECPPESGAPISVTGTISTSTFFKVVTDVKYNPTYIQFVDKQTGQDYVASISGASYAVELLNQHQYDVRGYWNGTIGNSPISQAKDVVVTANSSVFVQDLIFPTLP